MRVRCKQRITTTGLDIYFYKVKPGKNIDSNNIDELRQYKDKIVKTRFSVRTKHILSLIDKAVDITTRTDLITKLREYVKSIMRYDWYYEKLTPELTNQEIRDKIKALSKQVYGMEDVYFRKVNFVYAFFAPYLVDEECIVTKQIVRELITRCNHVIVTAKRDGLIDNNDEIINKKDYYYHYQEGENWLNITNERRQEEDERINKLTERVNSGHWIEVAKEELPTQSGFFFGSTDYDIYYLSDVLNCKNKFEKLLNDWKDGEVVYNSMSW